MPPRILSLAPAEPGWRAFYRGEYAEEAESARVVAWALVESDASEHEVVGLVIAADEPTRIVPAADGASAVATEFDRYGFRAPHPLGAPD